MLAHARYRALTLYKKFRADYFDQQRALVSTRIQGGFRNDTISSRARPIISVNLQLNSDCFNQQRAQAFTQIQVEFGNCEMWNQGGSRTALIVKYLPFFLICS